MLRCWGRSAAQRTGLIWNLRSAWQSCTRRARAGDLDAMLDWAALGGATAVSTLGAALSSPQSRRAALFALGFSGAPDAVDACLPMLSEPDLSPGGDLRFDLPRRSLTFVTRIAGRREEHAGTLAVVFIAPEEMKLSLVWQSILKVRAREVDELDETTVSEKSLLA